jgi:simple sugar transport system substrate-binding protein
MIVKGEKLPNLTEGGFDKDMVQNTPFGAGASDAARKAAAEATAALKGGAPIFVGPIKDNTGKTVSATTLGLYDPTLWGTNYLVEGVVGSVT